MENIVGEVRQLLKESADEETRNSSQRFFKESVAVYGVKSAGVRKIAKQMFSLLENKTKEDVFSPCEELWRSGYLEEMGIGRPSTYAPTISTIQKREYVIKESRDGKERPYWELTLRQGEVSEAHLSETYGSEKQKLFPTSLAKVASRLWHCATCC